MEFLHISDLHYRIQYPAAETGYLLIFKDMLPPLEQLKKGLAKVCLDKLSFILISGDLTEYGDEQDYRELKRQLDQAFGRIPYVVTLGNHDNLNAFCSVWAPGDDVRYGSVSHFGKVMVIVWAPGDDVRYGSVSHFGKVMVIALNNSSEHHPDGMITKEHCLWLETCLNEKAKAGDQAKAAEQVILMMHHPLITDPGKSMPAVQYPPCFTRLIKRYPIAAILSGHTHDRLSGTFNGVLFATAGSMSFKGYEMADRTVCFREYASMNLCRIEDQYISIREIPVTADGKILGTIRMPQSVR
ncbi:Calcineurin-like phosphoesterase [Popillia japonica]|uniref:Calcineurin-like phosphoesterase n=1 Tax=Popillia japonica TaxID=7064 RepID=A0AAW1H0J3_POPJA